MRSPHKVILSHPDRQHCHQTLIGLERAGLLQHFYTSLSANKLGCWSRLAPERLNQELRKRRFPEIDSGKINHYPLNLFKRRFWPSLHYAGLRQFDRKVARAIAQEDFDSFIGYENANLESFRAARKMGKTSILDLAQIHHNTICKLLEPIWPTGKMKLEREQVNSYKEEALNYTDYVITLSSFAYQSMLDNGWVEDRLFQANLGIDPSRFSPKSDYRTTGPMTFLMVGTMTRRKGVHLLLQAWRELQLNHAQLVLIGPMADAQADIEKAGSAIKYHPFMHHEQLADQYRRADVFVFPSLLDSWAQTVVEAMACGTPAIVTEQTGSKDAVSQGGGWVIAANNLDALKEQIETCYRQREEVADFGLTAGHIAHQYTWDRYHRQVVEIVKVIAQKKSQASAD